MHACACTHTHTHMHVAHTHILVPFHWFSKLFLQVAPAELAKAVLAEVPRQVVDYYRLVNLSPAQSQGHA